MRDPFMITLLSNLDWVTVASFFAVGLFYFLGPVLGYSTARRQLLAISMYILIGVLTLSPIQMLVVLGNGRGARGGLDNIETFTTFAVLKGGGFVAALVFFAIGLHSLKHHASADNYESIEPLDQSGL